MQRLGLTFLACTLAVGATEAQQVAPPIAGGEWISLYGNVHIRNFSFPWAPNDKPKDDTHLKAIATAAQELVRKRDAWLNPPGASAEELKKRTLTNLYNENPTWLEDAHRELDEAVLAAYGWPKNLSNQKILARLLQCFS